MLRGRDACAQWILGDTELRFWNLAVAQEQAAAWDEAFATRRCGEIFRVPQPNCRAVALRKGRLDFRGKGIAIGPAVRIYAKLMPIRLLIRVRFNDRSED